MRQLYACRTILTTNTASLVTAQDSLVCVWVRAQKQPRIMTLKESDRFVGKVRQAVTSQCGQCVCFSLSFSLQSKTVGMLEWSKSNSVFVYTWVLFFFFLLYHNSININCLVRSGEQLQCDGVLKMVVGSVYINARIQEILKCHSSLSTTGQKLEEAFRVHTHKDFFLFVMCVHRWNQSVLCGLNSVC